jgi:hypothetical protein
VKWSVFAEGYMVHHDPLFMRTTLKTISLICVVASCFLRVNMILVIEVVYLVYCIYHYVRSIIPYFRVPVKCTPKEGARSRVWVIEGGAYLADAPMIEVSGVI